MENKNIEEKLKHARVLQGDICLEEGWLDKAVKAYQASGVKIPREKIIARCDDLVFEHVKKTGATYMLNEFIGKIIETYALVDAKEKLIELGDSLSAKGINNKEVRDNALKAYQKAGATDKIVKIGDSLFQNQYGYTEEIIEGVKFYEVAGIEMSDEKLVKYADALVENEKFITKAVEVYEKAGIELTKEKLIEWGDTLSNPNMIWKLGVYGPIRAYQKAGATDKIVEWGDMVLARTKGRLDAPEYAVTVYKEAGLEFGVGLRTSSLPK